jgi:hypothetical protein
VNRTEKKPLPRKLEITNRVILIVLLCGSLLLDSARFSLGVLCGGLISVVNFHWLYSSLLKIFHGNLRRLRAAVLVRFYMRLAVTALVLAWVISGDRVDLIGLVVGLSVVVVSIILTAILAMSRNWIEEV